MLAVRYSLGRDSMLVRFILYLALVLVFPSFAGGLPVIAGFGDSITCDGCGDGSYLRLLGDYLGYDPVIDDNGVSADITGNVLLRLDTWLDNNTADVLVLLTGTPDVYEVGSTTWNLLGTTIPNIDAMISMVLAESIPVIVVAPPPVGDPCINPPNSLTCGDMNTRLASIAAELSTPAPGNEDALFLDLYAAFTGNSDWQADPNSFYYLRDGVHPVLGRTPGDPLVVDPIGDDLIASLLAPMIEQALIPEPSTAVLLASGLLVLAYRQRHKAA
jgi:hypothetical protein